MKLRAKLMVVALAILAFLAVRSLAAVQQPPAETTWAGKISDSMCGADHKENGGTMAKDHKCTLDCVKGHGSEYVFFNTTDKKIYKVGNQTFAGLETHAGHTVQLTGTMKGDTITVTKIVMPKTEK